MTSQIGYQTPAAFRRALTDRLKGLANKGRWTLPQLQRQIAYDRLLERLYMVNEAWVIKGATALIARNIGVRGTIDVDIYREVSGEVAERDLRLAAALDLGDWFRFELGAGQQMDDGKGLRVPVTAYVGVTVWVEFRVDLVGSDVRMTGDADRVPPLAELLMPNVEQHGYRAYPLVDHIADKFAAIRERGYAAEARRSLLTIGHTLDDALALVRPFIHALLDETAVGRWNPSAQRWET